MIGLMGFIALWMIDIVRESELTGHSRFNGTQQQLMIIFGIVGFVILFGVVSFVAGLWQLIAGKRNKVFIWLVAGMAFVLLIGAGYVILRF